MYLFYLGDVLLPIAPSKLEMKIKNQNKTMTLINEGEINMLKQPGLTEIDFECLLPNVKYPFASYPKGFKNGTYYLEILEKLKAKGKPFKFRVMRSSGKQLRYETSIDVSLESHTIKEDAKNGTDFMVDISLKQYKEYKTKVFKFKESGKKKVTVSATTTRKTDKDKIKTYTIKSRDTLWGIAKVYLGNGNRYKEIYQLNKDVIEKEAKKHGKSSSSGGNSIYVGTVLKIPQAGG